MLVSNRSLRIEIMILDLGHAGSAFLHWSFIELPSHLQVRFQVCQCPPASLHSSEALVTFGNPRSFVISGYGMCCLWGTVGLVTDD